MRRKLAAHYPEEYINEPLRHPDNKELLLHYDPVYEDRYVIQTLNGPVVSKYIESLIDKVELAYSRLPKVFAVRVDLYFPSEWTLEQRLNREPVNGSEKILSKDFFTRFIESLKSKLSLYYKATDRLKHARRLPLAYCRAQELGKKKYNRGLHIHVLLMTNGHAFYSLGNYSSKEALAKRSFSTLVREAWASALFGFERHRSVYPPDDWRSTITNFEHIERVFDEGLVHFSGAWGERHRNDEYPLEFHNEQMHKVIFAASYLCKAHTKYFSDGTHPFECSRSAGVSRGFQGAFKGVGVNSTPPVKTVGYHRGNERLKLVELQSGKSSTVLDHQAGSYIEADLNETWGYLEKKRVVSSDFVAIRFRLDIEPDILAKRKRFKYVERLYNHIEKSIRSVLGHVGTARSTDVSHLKALNSWQQERGQLFLHIVLFIEGSVFDQVLGDQGTGDYLQSFLAEAVSYTYGIGEQQARHKLTISSVHRLTQGQENFVVELRSLLRHLGYLCLSEPSISQSSTLYCR